MSKVILLLLCCTHVLTVMAQQAVSVEWKSCDGSMPQSPPVELSVSDDQRYSMVFTHTGKLLSGLLRKPLLTESFTFVSREEGDLYAVYDYNGKCLADGVVAIPRIGRVRFRPERVCTPQDYFVMRGNALASWNAGRKKLIFREKGKADNLLLGMDLKHLENARFERVFEEENVWIYKVFNAELSNYFLIEPDLGVRFLTAIESSRNIEILEVKIAPDTRQYKVTAQLDGEKIEL